MSLMQSRYTILSLSLSTVLSACIFFTTGAFATTMTLTDTEIGSRLKHAFSRDTALSGLKITPTVEKGQVHLKGTVNSADQAIEVIELAEHMQGVKNVDSKNLILKSNNRPIMSTDDIYITAKLKNIYEKNRVFGEQPLNKLGISVDTTDGVVLLHGHIKERLAKVSPEQYREQVKNAIKLAKELKGVKSINHENLILIVEYVE